MLGDWSTGPLEITKRAVTIMTMKMKNNYADDEEEQNSEPAAILILRSEEQQHSGWMNEHEDHT